MPQPRLWDVQENVIDRARKRLGEGVKRLIIQGSTGVGKTTISSRMMQCAVQKGKCCLFVAHRRRLIDQKSRRLSEFGVPHGIIMDGYPMTPAPVQVASADTLDSWLLKKGRIDKPPANLIVLDECHNQRDAYTELGKVYPDAVFIGLTATPVTGDGHGLGTAFWQAMECVAPVSRLIRDGRLVPVEVFGPRELGEKRRKGKERALAGNPIQTWRERGQGRPTILFTSKCSYSRQCERLFQLHGITAEHLDGHTSDKDREAIIARVESGETQVLCNVGVMTEGVDIPCLSCIILLRIAGSYVLYAQTVGRVMRAFPGKKDAILIDHSAAMFEHGRPDEDIEWTLDPNDTVDRRLKKKRDEDPEYKEPLCCPACGYFFSARLACPSCGHVLPKKKERVKNRDEILVEIARGQDEVRADEAKQRFWDRCLGIMAHRGQTLKAAAAMYANRMGAPPWNHGLRNLPAYDEWRQPVSEVFPQYLKGVRV